jgi:hypothetical protein
MAVSLGVQASVSAACASVGAARHRAATDNRPVMTFRAHFGIVIALQIQTVLARP